MPPCRRHTLVLDPTLRPTEATSNKKPLTSRSDTSLWPVLPAAALCKKPTLDLLGQHLDSTRGESSEHFVSDCVADAVVSS